eukprot:CCRYP_017888-RA/>CCRYP_017888-RA protein AED:0.28 eAED:0.28 QI:0/-1/0/1/-1/1/1/0/768
MSSRALRRLREEKEAALQYNEPDISENDDDDDDDETPKKGGFLGMLHEEESSSDDEEETEDDDDDTVTDDDDDDDSEQQHKGNKPVVVNEPSRSNTAKQPQQLHEDDEEDIDAILSSFHPHDETQQPSQSSNAATANAAPSLRSLLLSPSHGYDVQSLDLDHAMRSLLGSAPNIAVDDANNRQRRGGGRKRTAVKKYLFGRPRDSWGRPPSYVGGGLGCKELTREVLRDERNAWGIPWPYRLEDQKDNHDNSSNINNDKNDDSNNRDDDQPSPVPTIMPIEQQKWYSLTMSDTYQEQHYAYQQLLRSRNTHNRSSTATLEDPNALAMFVADHPHFAETLLQLSMVLYHVNDRAKGNDLLRRTMYLYETALPGSILPNANEDNYSNTAQHGAKEILMDIDRQPNSGLFATLFRIMQTSGMTGCFPNALAVGRFLLSLDPLRDPMGVLLILDYYALACRNCIDAQEVGAVFVKELVESGLVSIHYRDPLTDRHHWCCLRDMPGWAYSYALALYRLSRGEECQGNEDLEQSADEALIDALERFPSILSKLLAMNKVNTQDRSFRIDWPKVLPSFAVGDTTADGDSVQDRVTRGAGNHLVRIFVQRNHKLWAGDDVVQWLYRCAEKVVQKKVVSSSDGDSDSLDVNTSSAETATDKQPRLFDKFSPACARYAQFDPSEYEDAFRVLPPEAIALDPNIIAPAMVFDPNRRGRFLRRGQRQEDIPLDGGHEGLMRRLRELVGMGDGDGLGDVEVLDPGMFDVTSMTAKCIGSKF